MEPRWLRVGAIIVAVITAGSAYGAYNYFASTQRTGCSLSSTNPLIFDQAEQVHTLDPQWAYSTPDWGAVQQVYQPLVMYNQSSTSTFVGVLARSWTHTPDNLTWNFTLWPNIHFSNGDPVTAYVMWFSLYREIATFGADQYLLYNNFWLPNTNYTNDPFGTSANESNLLWELNNFNFLNPTAGYANETAVMTAPNQSFRVLDPLRIQLNQGYGVLGPGLAYSFLFAEISTVAAVAVDPKAVQQNGGVQYGVRSSYLQNNMLGTGPFLLDVWSPGNSISFKPDPNYWAAQGSPTPASTQPWNNNIQPARSSIEVSFQGDPSINIQNLRTGAAAGASFAYLGPGLVDALQGVPCVKVDALSLPYSSTNGGWWLYMNQSYQPFNNLYVREAIAHAINVTYLIRQAFGGWAYPWVGPVPPGYPYYNPANVSGYSYSVPLAKQLMAKSPWPTGYPATFNFVYVGPSPDWDLAAQILQQNLSTIGIKINPIPLPLNTYYTLETYDPTQNKCVAQETGNGGPFPIGLEFYTSDWISPDDWTLNNVYQYGSANMCMGGYNNPAMNVLTIKAAGDSNPAVLNADYANITQTLYQNYTDVWLVVPTLFGVYNVRIQGLFPNPIGSCLPDWNLGCNTEYASP